FQAEDGIRDYKVTGVQTCALPISGNYRRKREGRQADRLHSRSIRSQSGRVGHVRFRYRGGRRRQHLCRRCWNARPAKICEGEVEIGRASCRERVERWVGEGVVKRE